LTRKELINGIALKSQAAVVFFLMQKYKGPAGFNVLILKIFLQKKSWPV
jgi:hypothetical protein